jgi:TPR repeat protein
MNDSSMMRIYSIAMPVLVWSFGWFASGCSSTEKCEQWMSGEWHHIDSTVSFDFAAGEERNHGTGKIRKLRAIGCSERSAVIALDGREFDVYFTYSRWLSIGLRGEKPDTKMSRVTTAQRELAKPYVPAPFESFEAVERKRLKPICDGGDPDACDDLAFLWGIGWGGTEIYAESKRLEERTRAMAEEKCRKEDPDACEWLAVEHEFGTPGDPEKASKFAATAVELYRASCAKLEYESCEAGGRLLLDLDEDPSAESNELARKLLEAACRGDRAVACAVLSDMYREGVGGAADPQRARDFGERAIGLQRDACDGGDSRACVELAEHLMRRPEKPPAEDEINNLLRLACERGGAGFCLEAEESLMADEIRRDLRRELLEKACVKRSIRACMELGRFWEDGAFDLGISEPRIVTPDLFKARSFLQRACDGGHGSSCRSASQMAHVGDGTASRAFAERGCELQSATSCRYLAEYWEEGYGGPRDPRAAGEARAAAARLLEKDCEAGDGDSCESLADLHDPPGEGCNAEAVSRYRQMALEAFKAACAADEWMPCVQAGQIHEGCESDGDPGNPRKALEFYRRACELSELACDDAERLEARLGIADAGADASTP